MTEPIAAYQRVVDRCTELVDSIPDLWAAYTPCQGWTVQEMSEHVIVGDEWLSATVGGPAASPLRLDADLAEPAARWADGCTGGPTGSPTRES